MLTETAVQRPMGESLGLDRSCVGMFADNLRKQGFIETIQQQLSTEPRAELTPAKYKQSLVHLLRRLDRCVLRSVIAAVDQQISQPTEAEPAGETVSASEFVQEAIAQNAPSLDEELSELLDASEAVTVEELRDWYKSARALSRSEADLEQIAQLGKAVKTGEVSGLNQTDAKQMRSDRSEFDAQAGLGQGIAANARRFVQTALQVGLAHQEADGTIQADGRIYQIKQKESLVSIVNKRTGGGLVADGDEILKVSNLTEGDRRRWMKLGAKTPQELRGQSPQRQRPADKGIELG